MNITYKKYLLCALSSAFLIPPPQAKAQNLDTIKIEQEDDTFVMSLSTAIMFALDNNPDLQMATQRIDQMDIFAEEAKAGYWPQIEMELKGGRQAISPTSGSTNNNYGNAALRFNQKIFDGYATKSEVKRRESMKSAVGYEAIVQRNIILLDTIKYYLSVLRYQKEIKTLTNFNAELEKIVKNINEMYIAGAASKVMNDYALSRHASSQLDLRRAISSLNDAQSKLEFLTGKLPEFRAIYPDNLTPENYDFNLFYELAGTGHPSLKVNKEEIATLKHKLNVEKAGYFPDIDLNVSAEQKNNDGGDVGPASDVKAYVSLRYNLFDGFLKENKTKRVVSQIKELEFKNEKLMNDIKKNLELLYFQILSSSSALGSAQAEIQNSITVKILNEENFRLGNLNVIELIEGEERLKDALLKKNKLSYDLYFGKYSLLITSTLLDPNYFCKSCPEIPLASNDTE